MSERHATTLKQPPLTTRFNLPDNLQFKELVINVNGKTQGSANSRLIQEIGSIYAQCKNVSIKKCENNQLLEVNINDNIFVFELCYSYPFKMPVNIHVNGVNYNDIKRISDTSMIPYIKKYLGTDCFCCHSLLCANNWSPIIRVASIINEIQSNMIILHKIKIHILCDQIRHKYRCQFLMFEDYLF
jgi:hypothetical protein